MFTNSFTETNTSVITTDYSDTIDLERAESLSIHAVLDVNTPSAVACASGVYANLTVADLKWTAVAIGTGGNSISITITSGATHGAEVITVVGNAITIQIEDGVSTATEVKTAYDLSAAAVALATVSITGTPSNAQAAATIASLASGSATDINLTTNVFTKVAHGFVTGLKVQVTTSTTLPTGISGSTDYFIVKVDADTFKLSDTLAHALAGTNIIDVTAYGAGNQTFTPVAIAGGSIELQKSNDGTNFVIEGSATNVTADANVFLEKDRPTFKFARVKLTLTAGSISAVYNVAVKQ